MADEVSFDWWNQSEAPDISQIDPDIGETMKEVKANYYRDFATNYQRQQFNSLDDYQRWLRSMPNSYKEIDGFIRQLGMEYMPRKLKDEYEQQMAIKKSEDQFKRTIDMHGQLASKIQDAVDAGDLPKGVFFDPKTNGLNFKAPKTADPSKARNQLINELGKFRQFKEKADIEGAEQESAIYQSEIDRLLQELQGGSAASSPAMFDQGGADQLQQMIDSMPAESEDRQALEWAMANQGDPRAASILQMVLGSMQQ